MLQWNIKWNYNSLLTRMRFPIFKMLINKIKIWKKQRRNKSICLLKLWNQRINQRLMNQFRIKMKVPVILILTKSTEIIFLKNRIKSERLIIKMIICKTLGKKETRYFLLGKVLMIKLKRIFVSFCWAIRIFSRVVSK